MSKILILGLRPHFNRKKQVWQKTERFFEKKWRADNPADIFANYETLVGQVPEDQRYNIYWSLANCQETSGRELLSQSVLGFDIDDVPQESAVEVARVAIEDALNLTFEKVPVIYSGHGIQFFIGLKTPITSKDYFDNNRHHYKAVCDKIKVELAERNLPGKVDTSVFNASRIMRMPGTINRKMKTGGKDPNVQPAMMPDVPAFLIQKNYVPYDFDLAKESGLEAFETDPGEAVSVAALGKFPTPDTEAVQSECEFLKWTKAEPAKVDEPQWYGMLSIVSRLDNGPELAHQYSEGHPDYSHHETELKVEQALDRSGPLTCSKIDTLWDGCKNCKHYKTKLKSPIMIQGPNYIKTQDTGFHTISFDGQGNPKPGKPCVDDLCKFFHKEFHYISLEQSQRVFTYTGTHWQEMFKSRLEEYAQGHFDPKPTSKLRSEFVSQVKCTNVHEEDWFSSSTAGLMNFPNGVLDLKTMELREHSPEYGFRYVLPYEYNPQAKCPTFDQFMKDVTCQRQELEDIFLEFMGYSFSNDRCWEEKALILLGKGSNGKSTLMDLMKDLAGDANTSSLTFSDLSKPENRYMVEGKLYNVGDETSLDAFYDSSLLKRFVSGNKIAVRKLYHQPYEVQNRTKLIMLCNELPESKDKTFALYRRMLIMPFDAKFEGENKDKFMAEKLREEMPGILNRVIEGYHKLHRQRGFTESNIVTANIEKYRLENDSVAYFLDECCEIDPYPNEENVATLSGMYGAYRQWCDHEMNMKPEPQRKFVNRLKELLGDYGAREFRPRSGAGGRPRLVKGIAIIEESINPSKKYEGGGGGV